MAKNDLENNILAQKTWARYQRGLTAGHLRYQAQAKLCENFYLGAGRQWTQADKDALEESGRPWLEENIIFSTVNTVIGYQTQSRMDVSFTPRDESDQGISDVLSKIVMYCTDHNKYPWKESQVFGDGLIQQRGYFEIKMDFNENTFGDIVVETLDPLDVIPDPDAKSYDPDDWADVITTSWMSFDDIKQTYGLAAWRALLNRTSDSFDFNEVQRNKFGGDFLNGQPYYTDDSEDKHAKTISRQFWKLQTREYFLIPNTGDLIPVPDSMKPIEVKKEAKKSGYEVIKKTSKRIRWTVTTKDIVLFDEWSPYDHFTIVPFFPYFRRGKTIGLVDNLIKTQEMINKIYSQILHVVNTTANSGWVVEENSLTNMDVDDLEETGAQTGLVLEYKTGRQKPEKIQANQIPTGLKDLVTSGVDLIRLISGVSETFTGGKGPEVSGTAIQSRVHQAAVQLASPIDNLFRTRNMIAERILALIQGFYTQERTFMITGGANGSTAHTPISINLEDPEDPTRLINDVTVGKYDVVVADVPTQITFQNAQFSQAVELRKFGVQIPDAEMVKMSTLSRKNEIAKQLENAPTEEQQKLSQEQAQYQVEVLKQQAEEIESKAKNKKADTLKQIADVATLIAANPSLSPLMDALLNTIKEEKDEEDKMEAPDEGTLPAPELSKRVPLGATQ